jgi:betaine-aldehyde dehydrogenase
VCTNGTRVYVHRSLKPRFVEALLARVSKIRVGDPLDDQTQMGALISEAHMNK